MAEKNRIQELLSKSPRLQRLISRLLNELQSTRRNLQSTQVKLQNLRQQIRNSSKPRRARTLRQVHGVPALPNQIALPPWRLRPTDGLQQEELLQDWSPDLHRPDSMLDKQRVREWLADLQERARDRDEVMAGLKRYGPYAAIALVMLLLVDLLTLSARGALVPEWTPPVPSRASRTSLSTPSKASYATITDRNIFNSDGVIPDALGFENSFDTNRAVATSLPIQLVATIISGDPTQSLAILKLNDADAPAVYRDQEDIGDLAQIAGIRRGRIYFYVKGTRRLEYAEMPLDVSLPMGEFSVGGAGGGINQASERDFQVEKRVLEAQTKDLPSLLQQARAVPRMGPNGQVDGFKVEMIQGGSVFEQLGIKQGDVIRGVNGERLDSVGKAMSLYNTLRSGDSTIEIEIERNGRTESFTYSVN